MKNRERMVRRSELEYQKVARRMRTAIQIADAMEKHGISKKQLADMMGRRPSEITKWLSGDQNFTLDTLTELSYYLNEKITGETVVVVKKLYFCHLQSCGRARLPGEQGDFTYHHSPEMESLQTCKPDDVPNSC